LERKRGLNNIANSGGKKESGEKERKEKNKEE
jgi:hypothetical protein